MSIRHTCSNIRDFVIHTLANDTLSISIVPELGGRLVSLKHPATGREWLDGWTPATKRRIWRPSDPADYETGPGAGLDECLPTVMPCTVGTAQPGDHGELWNRPPTFDEDMARKGVFACHWLLKSLPLAFERRISIHRSEIRFHYRISNRADSETPFLWAWHPLFTWKRGDQIHTGEKFCLTPEGERLPWPVTQPGMDLSRAMFPKNVTPAAKVFLGPLAAGRAAIVAKNGATLTLEWPAELFPYAGIWITRGFWKGLHHWAIEPTNAPVDRLSDIHEPSRVTHLAPHEAREWTLTVKLPPNPISAVRDMPSGMRNEPIFRY
jgi:galactose mutarotase-like enzyme